MTSTFMQHSPEATPLGESALKASMKSPRGLLIFDTDKIFVVQFQSLLSEFYTIFVASEEQQAVDILEREQILAMFLGEVPTSPQTTLDVLKRVKSAQPYLPVIVVTDHPTVEMAVEAVKDGAYHYGSKTLRQVELRAMIEKAQQEQFFKRDYERIREELNRLSGKIVGRSPEMRRIHDQIRRVAMTDVTVLILGESGTGKELVAQEIHSASKRSNRPFVAVNCASLVKGLIESELFGHQRGSFTGAMQNKPGKFELAEGGTIFLDEIADLDLQSQVKILRVLQERVIDRVGGTTPIAVDVRVIAATNRTLAEMTARGEFREDLFYRLNIFPITLPALRQHKEDIPLLVEYYLQRYGPELGKPSLTISQSTMEHLLQYDWPGNVRELQNTIQRAILFCSSTKIEPHDLPKEITEGKVSPLANMPLPAIEKQARDSAARLAILNALEQTGWNVKRSAQILSVPEKTLYDKCSNLGIKLRKANKN
ncbi:MAG TPA: sigma-54 dependent transcriptional regulator [Bacteroidota bacterium]|nr:sigma-54 dependent transcriptional regulator [Bacteroidota bacterium]